MDEILHAALPTIGLLLLVLVSACLIFIITLDAQTKKIITDNTRRCIHDIENINIEIDRQLLEHQLKILDNLREIQCEIRNNLDKFAEEMRSIILKNQEEDKEEFQSILKKIEENFTAILISEYNYLIEKLRCLEQENKNAIAMLKRIGEDTDDKNKWKSLHDAFQFATRNRVNGDI